MYIKLRLASLDVRIAYVYGVGVAVHNHGRFVRVTIGLDWAVFCVPANTV